MDSLRHTRRSRRYGSAPPDLPPRSGRRRDAPLPALVPPPPPAIEEVGVIPPDEPVTLGNVVTAVAGMLAEHVWYGIRDTHDDIVDWTRHAALDSLDSMRHALERSRQRLFHLLGNAAIWVERDGVHTLLAVAAWVWRQILDTLTVTASWLRFFAHSMAMLIGFAAIVGYGCSQYLHFQSYTPRFYDDFAPACPPTFLYYPQYAAALNVPILSPSLDSLTVNGRNVNSAYKKQLVCYGPRKWRRHTQLDEANTTDIHTLLLDSHGKLQLGKSYPKFIMDNVKVDLVPLHTSPIWKATVQTKHTPNARRSFQDCNVCSLQEALHKAAWHLFVPANFWPRLPSTLDEVEATDWCPCTISAALAPFTFIFDFSTRTWRDDRLPPLGMHAIWFDDAAWDVPPPTSLSPSNMLSNFLYVRFLARLRAHGKAGYRSPYPARKAMACADQRNEVLLGRMTLSDFFHVDGCMDLEERDYLRVQRWKVLRGVDKVWLDLFDLKVDSLDL
ncbi:hypothetical protein P153DRAFT_371470, partial [Dothidotthia symphoricarpi CBS 119687]